MVRKALVNVTKEGVVRVMPLAMTSEGWAVNDREVWHVVGEVTVVKRVEQTQKGIYLTRNRGKWTASSGVEGIARNYAEAIDELLAYLGLERGTLEDATPALF